MDESIRYVRVINKMLMTVDEMVIGRSFDVSIGQVLDRIDLLEGLDYDEMFCESCIGGDVCANSDALVDCITRVDVPWLSMAFVGEIPSLIRSLRPDVVSFDDDGEMYVDENKDRMMRVFFDVADFLHDRGLWDDGQWERYRNALNTLEVLFENRLREFATAYEYPKS